MRGFFRRGFGRRQPVTTGQQAGQRQPLGEGLEPRLLMASVAGRVFNDYDADGTVDPTEPGLAEWAVYDDVNNNGARDVAAPTVIAATDASKAIPDPGRVTSTATVAGLTGSVADVNVTVNVTHGWVGDLSLALVGPNGVRVPLADQPGGAANEGNNLTNTTFDDAAPGTIGSSVAPYTGSFRPVGSLAKFNHISPNGGWTLEVSDAASPDAGTLVGWSLAIATAEQTALSDASGNYLLPNLAAGTHRVRAVVPATFAQTFPTAGAAHVVTLTATDALVGRHLGARQAPAEVRGTVWNDLDADGVRDAGEAGQGNVTVYVDLSENGAFDAGTEPSAVSASNGSYAIAGVPPGRWVVREVVPAGQEQTFPSVGGLIDLPAAAAGRALAAAVPTSTAAANAALPNPAVPAAAADATPHPVWSAKTPMRTTDADPAKPRGGASRDVRVEDARWTRTATNGPGLVQGQSTVLTWSVVADGTPIAGHNGEPAGASNLRAFLNGIYGSQANWLPLLQQVFDAWGATTGVSYQMVTYDDGGVAGTELAAAPGQLGTRADVRIGGHAVDGSGGQLGYAFGPDLGDMVIDTADNAFANTAGNSLLLRNVFAHEHGHGLGLPDVLPADGTKLMEPTVGTTFDGPQFDDLLSAHRGYGDRFEEGAGNDLTSTATDLGSPAAATPVMAADVSVDDDGDADVYRFSVGGARRASVVLTPVGPTYQRATGGAAPQLFDAKAQSDLTVQVLRADGSLLTTANALGVGGAERLADVALPSGGSYFLKVTGGSDAAQMYSLSLTVGGSLAGTHLKQVAAAEIIQNVDFGNRVPVLPAWVAPGGAATWNAATRMLTVTGAATINADPGSDAPIVIANAAAARLTIAPASATQVRLGGLNLSGGASAVVSANGPVRTVIVDGGQLNLDATSKLDLADNAMVVKNGQVAALRGWLTTGFSGGGWLGAGIGSSTAAVSGGVTALGYASNADLGLGTFNGVGGLAQADVLVAHTYYGDTNLDNLVNTDDILNILAAGKLDQNVPASWYEGDFTFDNRADTDDILAILATGRLDQ